MSIELVVAVVLGICFGIGVKELLDKTYVRIKTYYIVYQFTKGSESGIGRCFFDEGAKITRDTLEEWTEQIIRDTGVDSVVITFYDKMEERQV